MFQCWPSKRRNVDCVCVCVCVCMFGCTVCMCVILYCSEFQANSLCDQNNIRSGTNTHTYKQTQSLIHTHTHTHTHTRLALSESRVKGQQLNIVTIYKHSEYYNPAKGSAATAAVSKYINSLTMFTQSPCIQ